MLTSALAVYAQQGKSFAIVIDTKTYQACKADVDAYRDAVSADGFDAFVEARAWTAPEEVAGFLQTAEKDRNLAGAVFVGDIPVVMVNRAQHLTSAFKMAQDPDDLFNTTVPSDRFYDDFDLKFKYLCSQDTLGARYYYYDLAGDGSQEIKCDIFTGRIKPTLDGEAGYEQICKYLRKAVAEKQSGNKADCVVSFTGSGSFSNSLIAWKDETITLQEQFPEAFKTSDGARFYFFCMYPDIKSIAIKELKRDDVDLALFHEHGVPDTQYVGWDPPVEPMDVDGYLEAAKRTIRYAVGRKERYGKSREEAIADLTETYNLDSRWFTTLDDPEAAKADSIHAAKALIQLSEVPAIAPNARITLFDACYNGDFREEDCIASSYIFSDGKAVVSLGNTVNVLQDKSSSDLLGLLSCGMPIGQICQMTNILESHIIGDPTMHFAAANKAPDFYNGSADYWKGLLSDASQPSDVRGLALYKLYRLNYDGLAPLLLSTYRASKDYTVRLQCLFLAAHYGGEIYAQILKDALSDPYEFIRRKAVYWCGETGNPDFAPLIAKMYLEDYMALRLAFNMQTAAGYYGDAVKEALAKEVEDSFIFDKEKFLADANKQIDAAGSMRDYMMDLITNPETAPRRFSSFANSIRNTPDPKYVPHLIAMVQDASRDMQMRIDAAEALGWYSRYEGKQQIISAFEEQLPQTQEPALRDELAKTINRLKAYSR